MIILTGGAGFIGSCFLAELNAAGREDVLIVDSLRSGSKWKNLVNRKYIDIVSKGDFLDLIEGGELAGVDAVVHMGACSSTTETNADYLYENNYRYSVMVAEFAMKHEARFIYASSAATYGSGSNGYSDKEEDLRPLNMYGYSKHLFDCWVRSEGLDEHCVGLKFFNVFGPNEYHKGSMASLVSKAVPQIHSTGKVQLFKSTSDQFADGDQKRDFIYVKDVCGVMRTLLDRKDVNGILNLGTGVARSWNDVMRAVFQAMGKPEAIEYVEMPADLRNQYQNFTQADMSTFAAKLPDVNFTSLEDSIADYVKGYLLTEWPYI